jgi:hypothetical protein
MGQFTGLRVLKPLKNLRSLQLNNTRQLSRSIADLQSYAAND